MKKVIFIPAMALLLTVAFTTGCGRKEETKKVTIRYENWESLPAQVASHQKLVDEFNKSHPGIQVNFQPIQGNYHKILIEMAGGTEPDVFYWCSDILPPLVKKGRVLNLSPYLKAAKDIDQKDYFPKLFELLSYDDSLYAFPIYWGENALAYNKDLFDKAELPYPDIHWTWDDFLQAAQRLTIRKEKRAVQYGSARPKDYQIIAAYGGRLFNEGLTRCTANTPEVKNAFQFLLDMEKKYEVVPTTAEIGAAEYKGELEMFMTGRVAMFMASAWTLPTLRKIKGFQWDIAPVPCFKGEKRKIRAHCGCLCVSARTKYPQAAWEFVKFACSKKGQDFLRIGIPALKESAVSSFAIPPPANVKVFFEQVDEVIIYPEDKVRWYNEFYQTVYARERDKLFFGRQTIEETTKNIVAGAQKFLGEEK